MIKEVVSEGRRDAVARLLPQNEEAWWVPTKNDTLDRSVILGRLATIYQANRAVDGAATAQDDYEQSVAFVHGAFDEFEAEGASKMNYDWAFLAPARGDDASEVTDFLPLFDEKYGVTPQQMLRTVAHLAPVQIESYRGTENSNGMTVFVPAYFDTSASMKQTVTEIFPAAQRRVDEAARLVRQRYRVGLAGLGAVLPAVTKFGRTIEEPGLITTTGHGGTVHLLTETLQNVLERYDTAPRVGILGLGSIGSTTLDTLYSSPIDADIRQYGLYDLRRHTVDGYVNNDKKFTAHSSGWELLDESDVIIAAVTDVYDLDALEASKGWKLDLTGKVIIDDSQPGCFNREQVEARGGKLVWVVGQDKSPSQFLHRNGGYRYGLSTGLDGDGAVWGCEAEVGVLATLKRPDLALDQYVTPEAARKIGEHCLVAGVGIASPLQSFGRPVEF
jgi:hypothetical protein